MQKNGLDDMNIMIPQRMERMGLRATRQSLSIALPKLLDVDPVRRWHAPVSV